MPPLLLFKERLCIAGNAKVHIEYSEVLIKCTICVLLSRGNSCGTLSCCRRVLHYDTHAQGDALAAECMLIPVTNEQKPLASVFKHRGWLAAGVKQ